MTRIAELQRQPQPRLQPRRLAGGARLVQRPASARRRSPARAPSGGRGRGTAGRRRAPCSRRRGRRRSRRRPARRRWHCRSASSPRASSRPSGTALNSSASWRRPRFSARCMSSVSRSRSSPVSAGDLVEQRLHPRPARRTARSSARVTGTVPIACAVSASSSPARTRQAARLRSSASSRGLAPGGGEAGGAGAQQPRGAFQPFEVAAEPEEVVGDAARQVAGGAADRQRRRCAARPGPGSRPCPRRDPDILAEAHGRAARRCPGRGAEKARARPPCSACQRLPSCTRNRRSTTGRGSSPSGPEQGATEAGMRAATAYSSGAASDALDQLRPAPHRAGRRR